MLLAAASLSACTQTVSSDKISVVCSIFPQYDWVRQILGDRSEHIELTLLLDDRIDLHNYQPSVDDMVRISTCDLFIYVGGESDAWVTSALKDAINKEMLVLNLLDILGDLAKIEEIKEGMEDGGHDDDDNEEEEGDHDEDEHGDYD